MNSRERLLLAALIVILVGGVGTYFTLESFVKPLKAANARIADLEQETDDAQFTMDKFLMDRPKLDAARKKSLPLDPQLAASQYTANYLQPLLRESGLIVEDVTHSNALDVKLAKPIEDVKKAGHQLMTFEVRARGELADLVKAMKAIQATPYEHRIKNLQIDRADTATGKETSSKLNIKLVLEILMVAKTDNKTAPSAELDYKLLSKRNYDEIAKKNIFVGALPQQTKTVEVVDPTLDPDNGKGPSGVAKEEPDENVPAYVRLVTTDPDHKEAYLRNLIHRSRETRLVAKPGSGREFFKITDEVGDYVFFKAKILKVELREVYFQVKNQVYKLHIGGSLHDAIESGGLSLDQIDDLGLFDVYDREWAKTEMDLDKKGKTPTKKGGGRGR